MTEPFIKYIRSELAQYLHKYPVSNHVLNVIAYRVRRSDHPGNGLKTNQCFMGDYAAIGITRQQYRCAINALVRNQIITTKGTNKGTIVTLINTEVYDINAEPANHQDASSQPAANQQPTTNKECKNVRMKEVIVIPEGINQTAWDEWTEYRKSKKKKISAAAAKKQFTLLTKYSQEQQQEIINISISNDYQGLFDLKRTGNENPRQPNQQTTTDTRSAAGRVAAAADAERRKIAEQEHNNRSVGANGEAVRSQVDEQLRGSDRSREHMGSVIEGTYTRAD